MSDTRAVTAGIDGSEAGRAALEWALDYAGSHGLRLRLVTSQEMPVRIPGPSPYPVEGLRGAARTAGQRIIDDGVAHCRALAPDVPVVGEVVLGSATRALLDAARSSALIVVGARGLNPVASVLLGSVSTVVSAHASCPVVVVRGARRPGPEAPVVAGVDGSERDEATLAAAFEEASRRGASLVAVHAWSDPSLLAPYGGPLLAWPTQAELRDEATDLVERQLAGLASKYPAVRVDIEIPEAHPATALLALGPTAGLIVVGSRGRGGFTGMLLGSVARRLVHHAECPVLVVHPRQPDVTT